MTAAGVLNHLLAVRDLQGGCFLLLLDPDRLSERMYCALAEGSAEAGVDAILVGTSYLMNVDFSSAVRAIKRSTTLPIILLPGSAGQVVPDADAILFTSLLSGRNPTYLIDEQVKGAPLVRQYGLETIPTGYLLIESGSPTSVQFMSGTFPIPRSKPEIACAHALAAQYLGMKLVYLEAGSGAEQPVPTDMVQAVVNGVDIPIIVGGGLHTPSDCAERIKAGASFVTVGNHFERDSDFSYLREMTAAAHPRLTVHV